MRLTIRERFVYEVAAIFLVLAQHRENSPVKKWTTIIFFTTWAILTILISTGYAVEFWTYSMITAAVFYIVGRQHEAELGKLIGPRR